jgi:hypothetical protein
MDAEVTGRMTRGHDQPELVADAIASVDEIDQSRLRNQPASLQRRCGAVLPQARSEAHRPRSSRKRSTGAEEASARRNDRQLLGRDRRGRI